LRVITQTGKSCHHASSNVDLADAVVPTVGDVNCSVGESDVTKLVELGGGAHAVDRPLG